MERAVFRGKDEQDTQNRREQLQTILKNPVVEKPQDVANAIWDAVKHHKSEVIVGSANFSQALYRLFPGFTKWASQKALQNQDK